MLSLFVFVHILIKILPSSDKTTNSEESFLIVS